MCSIVARYGWSSVFWHLAPRLYERTTARRPFHPQRPVVHRPPQSQILFDLGFQYEFFKKFVGFPPHLLPGASSKLLIESDFSWPRSVKLGTRLCVISHLMTNTPVTSHFAGRKPRSWCGGRSRSTRAASAPPRPGDELAVEQFHAWRVRELFEVPGLDHDIKETTSASARTWRSCPFPAIPPASRT
jgi:hypothetical protein